MLSIRLEFRFLHPCPKLLSYNFLRDWLVDGGFLCYFQVLGAKNAGGERIHTDRLSTVRLLTCPPPPQNGFLHGLFFHSKVFTIISQLLQICSLAVKEAVEDVSGLFISSSCLIKRVSFSFCSSSDLEFCRIGLWEKI